ncbi:site-specific recombinase XerD [Mycobacteroides abscessus subsp. massiliense]|nr:site-specific recombinase XerD [Mycobacteroides abscessus subsp. massiliense]
MLQGWRNQQLSRNLRFRRYCDDLDLSLGLDLHSFRRSYATHLLEAGWDAMFVQHQMGHEHASTTAIYSCVSSDYRTRTLRNALDATIAAALQPKQNGGAG